MNGKILICYKSVTGFTRKYAEMMAKEVHATLMEAGEVTEKNMAQYDTVVFGGRFRAGEVDGLKRMKKLLKESQAKTFMIFATGAMPATAEATLEQAWENNLTDDERHRIPHFYMPGGLCYEKMPLAERMMMKAFAAVMKGRLRNKKDKTEEEQAFERMIGTSYDISSVGYIRPLVSLLMEKEGEDIGRR